MALADNATTVTATQNVKINIVKNYKVVDGPNKITSIDNGIDFYVKLKNYDDYEILISEPHTIRRISTKRNVKETKRRDDYITLHLDGKSCYKHIILAKQFIDNPYGYSEVDHIDRNRSNNSINNLRWVSHTQNMNNRNEYIKSGPRSISPDCPTDNYDKLVPITSHKGYNYPEFCYYYCRENNMVYKWLDNDKWHRLKVNTDDYDKVSLRDVNGISRPVFLNTLKKLYP